MTHDRPPPLDGPPPEGYLPPQQPPPPPRRRRFGLVILILLLVGSLFVNILLLAAVSSRFAEVSAVGGRRGLQEVVLERADTDDTIAVINVKGMITEQPMGSMWAAEGTSYDILKQQVDQARGDPDVKAVILKVNSPGGGASASDMMLHELKKLAGEKPMVVHMGSVAASGGYYVSMAADHIIAQETCITGSIGVIGQVMTFQELMETKLGIKVYTFASGDYKDVGNPFREMTVDEQIYLEDTLITPMFNRFVGVVVEGRKNLTERSIRDLANGKVYTAQQALDTGLIDQIGFFEDAVMKAKDLAGLAEARVVEYRRQVSLFDVLAMSSEGGKPGVLRVTPDVVNSWSTPQVLMLWRP